MSFSKRNIFVFLLVLPFVLMTVWWVLLNYAGVFYFESIDQQREIFAASYGLLALVGGLLGLYVCSLWGGFNSLVGKIVGFLSLGLLAQEFGQLSYSYYSVFLGIEVPYPSVGDIGFFGSIPLYILGSYYLVKLVSKSATNKNTSGSVVNLISILVPLVILFITYISLLHGYGFDTENLLAGVLAFSYPLFQTVYVSLALIAFYRTRYALMGYMHRGVVFLLSALVFQYFADFLFLYKEHRELYITGGVTDFVYLSAYFLMSLAIVNLSAVFERFKNGKVVVNGGAVD